MLVLPSQKEKVEIEFSINKPVDGLFHFEGAVISDGGGTFEVVVGDPGGSGGAGSGKVGFEFADGDLIVSELIDCLSELRSGEGH